jgi:hypothetical protein
MAAARGHFLHRRINAIRRNLAIQTTCKALAASSIPATGDAVEDKAANHGRVMFQVIALRKENLVSAVVLRSELGIRGRTNESQQSLFRTKA